MNITDKAIKEVRDIRLADEKKEKGDKMNKWFKNLNELQTCFMMMQFWGEADYEEKERLYKRYKYK